VRHSWVWIVVAALAAFFGAAALAAHLTPSTLGHTTLEQVVTGPDPDSGYVTLTTQAVSGSHLVRDSASEGNAGLPTALTGRANRRRSLVYLGQLTDFQLADEESPVRVEFADSGAGSAWRPQ